MTRTIVLSDWGHRCGAPRAVRLQSTARMRAPASPPPLRKSAVEAPGRDARLPSDASADIPHPIAAPARRCQRYRAKDTVLSPSTRVVMPPVALWESSDNRGRCDAATPNVLSRRPQKVKLCRSGISLWSIDGGRWLALRGLIRPTPARSASGAGPGNATAARVNVQSSIVRASCGATSGEKCCTNNVALRAFPQSLHILSICLRLAPRLPTATVP